MSEYTSDKRQSRCPRCSTDMPGPVCASCGWKRGWRDPKPRRGDSGGQSPSPDATGVAQARARAREEAALLIGEQLARWLKEPRPTSDDLVTEALLTLRGLMLAEGVPIEPKDRIAAASRVLEWVRGSQDFAQELERIQGTPEAALEWCERMAAGLREKIANQAAKLPEGKKGR